MSDDGRRPAGEHAHRPFGVRLLNATPVALLLYALWLILSPQRDPFHLCLGAVTVVVVTVLFSRLGMQEPAIGAPDGRSLLRMSGLRFLGYLPWLAWEVLVASVQVAYIVLHPRLPVSPRVVRIKVRYPHTVARLTLANSITLTPGTVTLDVDGDEFLVHALTETGSTDLEQGSMPDRVSRLFADATERRSPR